MLQITRAAADEDEDPEESEAAYSELVEYVRVAAQLFYEELAELRHDAGGPSSARCNRAAREGRDAGHSHDTGAL